jgi:hypothetical protein
MKDAIKVFRRKSQVDPGDSAISTHGELRTAGDMGPKLQGIFDKLSDTQRKAVLEKIDTHSEYLITLGEISRAKMQNIIDNVHGKSHEVSGDISGPGIYASRWQSLLDETLITPSVSKGPPRQGKDIKGLRAVRKLDNQPNSNTIDPNADISPRHESPSPVPPDVSIVVKALGPQFKRMVADMAQAGLPEV